MKRYIRSDKEPQNKEDILSDALSALKDDFNFAISGIEKIAADGDLDSAIELVESASSLINDVINTVVQDISVD